MKKTGRPLWVIPKDLSGMLARLAAGAADDEEIRDVLYPDMSLKELWEAHGETITKHRPELPDYLRIRLNRFSRAGVFDKRTVGQCRRYIKSLKPRTPGAVEGRLYSVIRAAMLEWLGQRGFQSTALGMGVLEFMLGYSMAELREHIECQFVDGMSWDNWGEWHIDHITPKSWCKSTQAGDTEFHRCWSLENLKPIPAKENLSKGARHAG